MDKKNNKLQELLREAKKWSLENLLSQKVFHQDIDDYVVFNRAGIEHAIYSKTYHAKVKMIYNAIDLFANSKLFAVEKDKANRPEIKKIYRFVNDWTFEGTEYSVYIIVRETNMGKFYYDHGIIKEKT